MKNTFSIIIFFIFIISNAQKKPIPQKPLVPSLSKDYKPACGGSEVNFKKIDNWYNEKYTDNKKSYYNFKKAKSLKNVLQQYELKNDILFHNKNRVDSLMIFYRQNDNTDYLVYVVNGKTTGYTINANNNPRPSMYSVSYDKDGNINYNFIKYRTSLLNGNGILKNYYYSEWNGENQKFSNETLKEEGEVRNNFKFGEWKYYNKEGKIDSTKIYTLKDSVDVRFPHCIFNKKEPCY